MSRPKGSKNKIKIHPTKKTSTMRENSSTMPSNSTDSGMFQDREAINERADIANHGVENDVVKESLEEEVQEDQLKEMVEQESQPETETQEDQPEEIVEQETSPVEEETQEAEPEKTEAEYKTETPQEKAEAQPEEFIKKVPLSALHEEREKRKERDRQIDQLISDNRELMRKQREGEETTGYETEEDNRVNKLEQRVAHFEEREEHRNAETEQTKVDAIHAKIGKTLDEKNYPGYLEFGKSMVIDTINRMNPEDRTAYDSPEGLMQVYIEQEYPKVEKMFEEKFRKEHFNKKDELKSKANLVRSTGKVAKPQEGDKKKLTPYEEYIEERAKLRL